MAVEMRKRPVVKGKDASNFLLKAEQNKKLIEAKKVQALKKWNEQGLIFMVADLYDEKLVNQYFEE